LNDVIGVDPWTGAAGTAAKPNSASDVAARVGSGFPNSEPISKLPYFQRALQVPNSWSSSGYEYIIELVRFNEWGKLATTLSNIVGAYFSCVYEAASYAASQHGYNYPALDYRSAWATKPGDLPVDDVNRFLHKFFDGNKMTIVELEGLDIHTLRGVYNESMMAKLRISHTESHMVNVVGHRGGAIVFYDPAANGYRYMPWRDFYDKTIRIFNNVINPIAP